MSADARAPASERPSRSLHPSALAAPPAARGLAARLRQLAAEPNAIWMREMRQSARLARTPWVLFSLVLGLTLLLASIGGMAAASNAAPAELGGALFQVFFSLAYLVVILVGPAVAANSIASEREGRTWEAVLLTGMTPQQIARGKFLAAYTTMALYLVALAPIGALSFLFGGVTTAEVVVAFAFLFLVAALAVAFGLAVSSLMASLRGAIVVTLMLAIAIGPILYVLGGFVASLGVHKLWSDVPEAFPVWLPLAYERAPFGLEYVVLLVAFPLLLVAAPAWFLYEATIANLTGESDDRSTGLKRWFAVCALPVALACATPSLLARDDDSRMILGCAGVVAFGAFHALCAMLFAAEPPGPSRRVRVHWDRAGAGALRRFFGPGLLRTMALVSALGVLGAAAIAAIDAAGLYAFGGPAKGRSIEALAGFTAYLAPFGLFVVGLVAWLRSRNGSPWVARIVAGGVLFLVSAAPWVVAAVAGVLTDSRAEEWLAIGSPSPFYAAAVVGAIEDAGAKRALLVGAGMIAAAAWATIGMLLLGVAGRRSAQILADHDEAVKKADAALAAEEQALAEPGAGS